MSLQSTVIRMTCIKKSQTKGYHTTEDGKPAIQHGIELNVPYCSDKASPNFIYSQNSGGTIFPINTINDAAADLFVIGAEYDITITPVVPGE